MIFLRINLPNFVQFIDADYCEISSIDYCFGRFPGRAYLICLASDTLLKVIPHASHLSASIIGAGLEPSGLWEFTPMVIRIHISFYSISHRPT